MEDITENATDYITQSSILQISRSVQVPYRDWYVGIFIWMHLPITIGIPGNILVLISYIKFPSLHSPTNLLICNQSLADLFSCFFVEMFVWFNYTIVGLKYASNNKYACLICLCCSTFSLWSSLANLLALSVERFLAIAFPYQYLHWISEGAVKKIILFLWMTMSGITSLPLLGWNTWTDGNNCMSTIAFPQVYTVYFFMLPSLLVLILTAACNAVICAIAVSKKKGVAPQPPAGTQGKTATGGDSKVTKMLLMVVGIFYICWLPFVVITTMLFIPPESWMKKGPPEFVFVMHEISKGLLLANAAANPLVYARRSAAFRDAFRKLLKLKDV